MIIYIWWVIFIFSIGCAAGVERKKVILILKKSGETMISEKLKIEFLEYKTKGNIRVRQNQEKVVNILTEALKTEQFTDEEISWVYWNISDELALMRKQEEQYANHQLFEKHILSMDEKYLHWLTSDGTQKLNLYEGGHEQFWNERYKYACEKSSKIIENRMIRYESHRASITFPSLSKYKPDKNISRLALENMKKMLDDELVSDFNYEFHKITYFTQYINFNTKSQAETTQKTFNDSYSAYMSIYNLLEADKADKNEPDENYIYLIGSWQQLNYSKRPKFNQAIIGIKNYIIALVNAGKYDFALDCYEKIKSYNLEHNSYFKSRIELAEQNVKRIL